MDSPHLLVPIKVQALVIDNLVIKSSGVTTVQDKYVAKDGRWSPLSPNYHRLINSLDSPGPRLFYGAQYETYGGKQTSQLVFRDKSPALPQWKDRGVYLHWVVPSGLRHAYKPGSLEFPALPDQWLIVRFKRDAELQIKAWFVDSSLVITPAPTGEPANLLLADGDKYKPSRVGKVVPLDNFVSPDAQAKRTTVTALGNQYTGSPTFTAFVAENRNILSWHDNLDLAPAEESRFSKEAALSYLVLGWYRDEQNEPLAVINAQLADKKVRDALGWPEDSGPPQPSDVLNALGWRIDSPSLPTDLLKRRALFHGMVAHINYWNPKTYKGSMLGYPGSPPVEGVLGSPPPSFVVGIGNNAEDALVSLVSSEFSGAKDKPYMWKALEAVIYRQTESLAGSWNTASLDMPVHQNWFSTVEAGKVWSIRPRPSDKSVFPADPKETAAQTEIKPTPEQLSMLKQLNKLQSEADALSRELSALQQDLYAHWWRLCKISRDTSLSFKNEEEACKKLTARVSALIKQRAGLLEQLISLQKSLETKLLPKSPEEKLLGELELRYDAAPRFWTPADPVIVLKNCGLPTKHQFPRPLPCRLPAQTVTSAEVVVSKKSEEFKSTAAVSQIVAAVQKHFAPYFSIFKSLLEEAAIVEQAISDLVKRTLLAESKGEGQFFDSTSWRSWTSRLIKDAAWNGDVGSPVPDPVYFKDASSATVPPHRLVELWSQQPWSPLFIDWQITWYPTPDAGQDFGAVWSMRGHDFEPVNKQSLSNKGFTVQGRSLLSPIDERIFKEPIQNLRELLKSAQDPDQQKDGKAPFPTAVADILSRYQNVWDTPLKEIEKAGLLGQALTGFHQALLSRDVTLPRVMPDPARPWAFDEELEFRDHDVKEKLDLPDEPLVGERLAPPAPSTAALPFTMFRAGIFKLDELWLVDDFGQWADLLHGTIAGGSFGQVLHPRSRWSNDRFAMPPRVVQPTRLNFRFTAADDPLVESSSDPALSPICGWIFYNSLDQALVLCDKDGRFAGELVIKEEKESYVVKWETRAEGVALSAIKNGSLKAFAEALIETVPTKSPRLLDLLKLIDGALKRIRPATARRDAALFGRPLALVSATIGLELFGKSWTDPKDAAVDRPSGTGNALLDKLRLRVNLGCSRNVEDGLVGYFHQGVFNRFVPAYLPDKVQSSVYLADPEKALVHVGFGEPERLTLLMDPWGSVQAVVGLVPAKTITLAQPELDKTLERLEASFRVGPVLLEADRLAVPTPTSDKGTWNFSGPLTKDAAEPVVPYDTGYFSDKPLVATEGRLLFLNTEK